MTKGCINIKSIDILQQENKTTLVGNIDDNGKLKKIQYSVEKKYQDYLTRERSDAFVVALLYYAMVKGYDITWNVPCDEKLIFQLKTFFIPVYAKQLPFMNTINLSGPVINENINQFNGVATGFSNGVDSCYTIKKYTEDVTDNFKLTHLIFTNWFLTEYSDDNRADFMATYLSILPEQAKKLALEFIFVDFDLDENFSIGHMKDSERGIIQDVGLFTLKYCSIALALQKLISVYYFSGAVSPGDFSFKTDDMAYHDIFTLPLVSSTIQFYSSGMEVTRYEKAKYIADWKYAQDNLQVCTLVNDCNCGKCEKCIRTMGELYACGKLENFTKRFPVEDFEKHLPERMAKILVWAAKKHVFEEEIVQNLKNNNIHIPYQTYLLFPVYYLFEQFRVLLRENKIARKIYRNLQLDIKLYGKRTYSKYLDDEK